MPTQKLFSHTYGGYTTTDWNVVDSQGTPVTPPIPAPGLYVVIDNAYTRLALLVTENGALEEIEFKG